MAHKKGEGSTQNGRDSISKRLGVKLFGSQSAIAGNIIIRQRGTKFHPGENVYMGKDYTLHAGVDGTVAFRKGRHNRTFVSIIPFEEVAETIAPAPQPKKVEKVEVPVAKAVKVVTPPAAEEKPDALEAPAAETVAAAAPVAETIAPAPQPKKVEKVEVPVAKAVKVVTPPAAEEKPEAPAAAETVAAAARVAEKKAAPAPKKAAAGKDDLKKVEGIGPKIASLLNDAGINTFAELAASSPEKIREILEAAGSRYRVHDPATWPQQAGIAAEGKWDELKHLQDELKGGKAA